MRKVYLLHPIFFSLLPAIFLWGQNFGEVPMREVLPSIVLLLLFGGIVLFVFKVLFRNFEKAALAASSFLFVTLLFNYIYNIFFDNSLINLRLRWVFVVAFIILLVFWLFLRRTNKNLFGFNLILTLGTGVFVLLSFVQVVIGYFNIYTDNPNGNIFVEKQTEQASQELRDIYYIVLDGYSSPEVMNEVLGLEEIDRTVNFLEENNFFVAKNSKSNYPATLLSLPSTLNMTFLEDPNADRRHFTMTENHKVKDFLKGFGYKYIHLGADAFTYFNRYADENINIGLFSPYQSVLWHNTIFKPLQDITGARVEGFVEKIGFLDSRMIQWKREIYKLSKLSEITKTEKSPIFVFAHFLIPKGDYVFNSDGEYLSLEEAEEKGNIRAYLDQTIYINKEIEKFVPIILENSNPEPIIIIQGDHGFPFYNNINEADGFADVEKAKGLVVPGKYSFPILNAYHFPDGGRDVLYDSITPVNTFRALFNYYFNQSFNFLEDTSYTVDVETDSRFIIWDK